MALLLDTNLRIGLTRWWKWAVSIDGTQSNPFTDATGTGANLKQSGPVFFLGGISRWPWHPAV